jgi:hypothetical protein
MIEAFNEITLLGWVGIFALGWFLNKSRGRGI